MIAAHCEPAPLTATDRALIGELGELTTKLERLGLLEKVAAEAQLLPEDILEEASERRTAHLSAARDRCRRHLLIFERGRRRTGLLSLIVPFVAGFAGTPYIVHLLS